VEEVVCIVKELILLFVYFCAFMQKVFQKKKKPPNFGGNGVPSQIVVLERRV
jgi:hypothetical protein